jgi:hypothetical protein
MEAKNDFHLSSRAHFACGRGRVGSAEKPALKPSDSAKSEKSGVFEVPILPGSWGRPLKDWSIPTPEPAVLSLSITKSPKEG